MSQPPVALISGGGTGIGATTARRLVPDGLAVVLAGRRRDRLDGVVAELGEHATAVQLDVTDDDSVRDAVAGLERTNVLGTVRLHRGPIDWRDHS